MKLCTCPDLHALYDDYGIVRCTKCKNPVDACKVRSYRLYLEAKKEFEKEEAENVNT